MTTLMFWWKSAIVVQKVDIRSGFCLFLLVLRCRNFLFSSIILRLALPVGVRFSVPKVVTSADDLGADTKARNLLVSFFHLAINLLVLMLANCLFAIFVDVISILIPVSAKHLRCLLKRGTASSQSFLVTWMFVVLADAATTATIADANTSANGVMVFGPDHELIVGELDGDVLRNVEFGLSGRVIHLVVLVESEDVNNEAVQARVRVLGPDFVIVK